MIMKKYIYSTGNSQLSSPILISNECEIMTTYENFLRHPVNKYTESPKIIIK